MTKLKRVAKAEANEENLELWLNILQYQKSTETYIQELKKANKDLDNIEQKAKTLLAEADMTNKKEKLNEEVVTNFPVLEVSVE